MIGSRVSLHLEIIALRHQVAVVNRSRRPRLRRTPVDRMLWTWLSRSWRGWRSAIPIVTPETVIAWHRAGFRLSGLGRAGIAPSRGILSPQRTLIDRRSGQAHLHQLNTPVRVRNRTRTANDSLGRPRASASIGRFRSMSGISGASGGTDYMRSRTHLELAKDTPNPRPVTRPSARPVVAISEVSRLHHRYDGVAAEPPSASAPYRLLHHLRVWSTPSLSQRTFTASVAFTRPTL